MEAAFKLLISVYVMTYSRINWEWTDIIPFQLGLSLKWSTPVPCVDVRKVSIPFKPYFGHWF